jgi:hypothetical protein
MSANGLGPRKVRAIARMTGLEVVSASVWSHNESGRYAHFRTADGRCWWLDRRAGTWERHGLCEPGVVAR